MDRPALDGARSVSFASLAPSQRVYAIGDVHGCADLLERLLESIDADLRAFGSDEPQLIFLGDYVDRGEASDRVLARLFALSRERPEAVRCLMGNHERMMLEFLDDPAGRGARWLGNGGLQTLASFGIGGLGARPALEDMTQASEALAAAMPEGMEAWLRALPLMWRSGNLVCVHAALDPAEPPEAQKAGTLLWGHPKFLSEPRRDGLWVVHGHTIVEEPEARSGRIAIDTGAYHSGRLTAVAISAGQCRFL
ncbi:serine/threonine protein phosphatase [Roseovarius sp. LXJ103]|nr:serine/threonine protein phosphatase [Roseovarius carneus]PWE37362.1 serine/threonine protein phosphatase [Pelagicola sp. LXJ1103]